MDYVIRPVRVEDHGGLTDLVGTIADGLTSLPNDPDFLENRIHQSVRAFYPHVREPGGEAYLFVLESLATSRIVGTSGIVARVGGFEPFYTYQIQQHEAVYAPLGIRTQNAALHLLKNHKGPSEICALFLHPAHRKGGLGRLLSVSRFLFIRQFPERFAEEIIAEMRGYIDDSGRSPFWAAVGEKFFQKDYYTADILSGLGEKAFIEALMPAYPIYTSLLPEAARAVIGRVHKDTEPALKVLLAEGFERTAQVDIFDAGPLIRAERERMRSWQASRTGRVKLVGAAGAARALVSNARLDWRAGIAPVERLGEGWIGLTNAAAEALELKEGDAIQYLET